MNELIKEIEKALAEIMEQYNNADRHLAFRMELASKWNVDTNLFRGSNFFSECARKQACRSINNA